MDRLKRLWSKIAPFVYAIEGVDDPTGDYMLSLGKRVDKLEREVAYLERQLHPRSGVAAE